MNTTETDPRSLGEADFRHEALFYEGDEGFVAGIAPFVRDGVERDEAVLVVVNASKIDMLRAELPGVSDRVMFADMAQVGRNPARIIPAWRDFLDRNAVDGLAVRGVGEPIWATRTPAELVESQRHEALLNVAFAGSGTWRLLCPYDTSELPQPVLDEAARSHAFLADDRGERPSADFHAEQMPLSHLTDELPEPPRVLEALVVDGLQLGRMRVLVAARAQQFGMEQQQTDDLMLAASEVAANSVVHGGGTAEFRLWRDAQSLVCEIRDSGHIDDALAGRERPATDRLGGRGLWLANQLCDLVQIRSFPSGGVVRLHMSFSEI
jgi:anti-sigma regulatory factor (Ser/Thr protein kinase)